MIEKEKMSRIKYFKDEKIAIYIYGEQYNKHHGKHILVLKKDEDCQYDFNGNAISGKLRDKDDRKLVREWILNHQSELEKAWADINNGINPETIND
jgi:hypothetical protein